MKRNSHLSIALLLLSGSLVLTLAQDAEMALYTRITTATEKNEPDWKLARRALLPDQLVMRWDSNKDRLIVAVSILPSVAKAKEVLKSEVDQMENRPSPTPPKTELKDFGDECYMLKSNDGAGAHILFRQGIYYVHVGAPTEEVARRFVRDVSNSLQTTNNRSD